MVVLLTGQPGTPQDWIGAGRLVTIMNAFASTHAGFAPIVVIPDPTGGPFADPLCVDSPRGRADTYLGALPDTGRPAPGEVTNSNAPDGWWVAASKARNRRRRIDRAAVRRPVVRSFM